MLDTLVLNANAQPISLLPISSISWQEAVKFLYLGVAESLHNYEDWKVHSPSTTMLVPSVLLLSKQIKIKQKLLNGNMPQRHLVFLRDRQVCQYCNEQFMRSQLTIDHVIPKYHGGRTCWENVTTACEACNCKRGHDFKIQPRIKPYRPTYGQLLKNMRSFPVSMPSVEWNHYLNWDESKIRIVSPRNGRIMNDRVDFGIKLEINL